MTELKIVSSLEKIFAHGSDDFYEVSALSMLRGERLNFQLAVRSDEPVRLTVDCDGAFRSRCSTCAPCRRNGPIVKIMTTT